MDIFSLPPLAALLDATYAALMGLAGILEPLLGTASAAGTIILVTLVVRLALIPVGIAQAKAERARARLAPRLRDLQRRYRTDRERLRRETMRLYADEGVSPTAGCLPVMAQLPVLGVITALFYRSTIAEHANALLAQGLLGVPLGSTAVGAVAGGTLDPHAAIVFATVVIVLAIVGEFSRRTFRVTSTTLAADASSPVPSAALRLTGALHFATAVVAIFVPLAAGLYLVTTSVFTLAQRVILRRIYPAPE